MTVLIAIVAALGWGAFWAEVRENARRAAARELRRPARLSETPAIRRAMRWRAE